MVEPDTSQTSGTNRAPTPPNVGDNKTAARIGVAFGATMLIVGLTGTSWLKMRPQTDEEQRSETGTTGNAEPPALITQYPELLEKPAPPTNPGRPANLKMGFLRMQFNLAIRRLRGDPELAKLDAYVQKQSPAAKRALAKAAPPPNWPRGFNPALHAFKALAYATIIVAASFSAGIYATCRHYDAWDIELLAYDIRNTMTARLRHIQPFFDRHMPESLRSVKKDERDPLVSPAVDHPDTPIAPAEWMVMNSESGDEEAWFTADWWDKVTEVSRLEEEKKQQRLAVLIQARNERARQRQMQGRGPAS